MTIMERIMEQEDYMIRMRRHFHRYPELSDHEEETVKTICQELADMGIDYVDVPRGGVLGFIRGSRPGKTVMLRADIDALSIQESPRNLAGDKPCVSEHPGVCHACGHDGHTAMLLAAGKVLKDMREELEGTVILMFERGEEGTGNACYLYKYILDHQISIDSCYGEHLYAFMDSGKVSVRPGSVMAGTLQRIFRLTGRAGHTSRPDQAVNPVDCFGAICHGLQSIRMRSLSPYNTFTTTVPMVRTAAASSYNIIPDTLEFAVVARLVEPEDGNRFVEEVRNLVEEMCRSYHCTWELTGSFGPTFPVRNDPDCARMARAAIEDAVGKEHMEDAELWMASESMSRHLALWPGVLAFVGIRNPEKGTGASHHNEKFDVDEDALKYGAAASVAYAAGFLKSGLDTSGSIYKWNGTVPELIRANNAPVYIKIMEEIMQQP